MSCGGLFGMAQVFTAGCVPVAGEADGAVFAQRGQRLHRLSFPHFCILPACDRGGGLVTGRRFRRRFMRKAQDISAQAAHFCFVPSAAGRLELALAAGRRFQKLPAADHCCQRTR